MRHRFIQKHTFGTVIWAIALIEGVILVASGWYSESVVGWHTVSVADWLKVTCKYSGQFSLLLFAIIFISGPGGSNLSTRVLIKPYHAFAWAHGIHLAEVVAYLVVAGISLHPTRAAGGALAYAMVFALPLLENRMKAGRFSPIHFAIAEYAYHYYVWLIFFLTYLTRVLGLVPHAGGSYAGHVIGLGFVSLLMGSRIVTLLMRRSAKGR